MLKIKFKIDRENILNSNKQLHRFVKRDTARRLREIGQNVGNKYTEVFNHYTVDVFIYPPTRRRFDPPNLYPTVKHLIDGLTDSGLWEDDDWKHMKTMSFSYGGDTSGEKDVFIFELHIKEIKK